MSEAFADGFPRVCSWPDVFVEFPYPIRPRRRLMARRDPVGIRLLTRRGNDWSNRFPLVVEAMNHLKVRSCDRR
jgi:hypothetical protein